jgi:hypothetical protein
MQKTLSIPKTIKLLPSEDYHFLRQKGMEYIQALGSKIWTDYNIHDPGITTLELMCYAITDLAYRTGFDVKDIFAKYLTNENELKKQAFFPAHEILVNNPLTINDYRKLLIDQIGVKNAWLIPRICNCQHEADDCGDDCNCELVFFADHLNDNLTYNKLSTNEKISIKGLYDVLLSLENDPIHGDINDGRVYQTIFRRTTLELRLTEYSILATDWKKYGFLKDKNVEIQNIQIITFLNKKGNAITVNNFDESIKTACFLSFKLIFNDAISTEILLENVILNIYKGRNSTENITFVDIENALIDNKGIVKIYKKNIEKIDEILIATRKKLQTHRNLDEDFCEIHLVPMQDISVCMDIELMPDADIEKVQAKILVLIEQYLNPTLQIHSLIDMLNAGYSIDDVFDGPRLENGFIKQEELVQTELKREIHASDMINFIMDIEGVISVNNFLMTRYDKEGNPIVPHSQSWILEINRGHQARLYVERSKILFYKNGFPFLAVDTAELNLTLQQYASEYEQIKTKGIDNTLPIPQGEIRDFEDYHPVQHSFPMNYGIGQEGLPSNVTPLRKAQAKQFKAYLFFFEQLLVNYLAQLQHAGELFLVDSSKTKSYFTNFFDNTNIADISLIYNGLNPNLLQDLLESNGGGVLRRNQFMDHLLARFGESFNDYALMLYDKEQKQKSQEDLLKAKCDFLENYAHASVNRAKAIDYTLSMPCESTNIAGIQQRLKGLLDLAEEDIIVVEHLLLRPRIVGALFLPLCIDGDCHSCYADDPYSFRLTYVMPGWKERYMDLDFRRFAERTTYLETPSHLLPKLCWVDNSACNGTLLCDLKEEIWKIQTKFFKKDDVDKLKACAMAQLLINKIEEEYRKAIDLNNNTLLDSVALKILVDKFVLKKDIRAIGLSDVDYQIIKDLLITHWTKNTGCYVYTRFKKAWCEWLKVNAEVSADDLHLDQQLKQLLQQNNIGKNVCSCVKYILQHFGETIRTWVLTQYKMGLKKSEFDTKIQNVVFPADYNGLIMGDVKKIFTEFYTAPILNIMEKHAIVIDLMTHLKSIYPPATLHDCEDGNDKNPVRLNATVLG